MIFDIKSNSFKSFFNFYFRHTPFRVEIFWYHFHKLKPILSFIYSYFDFLFSASWPVYSFSSCVFDFFISNKWIEDLLEVHAIKCLSGWKTMLVMNALPAPLLNSWRHFPSSALNILIIVPFVDADATRVPSKFTARAPTSASWAFISTDDPFSLTKYLVNLLFLTVV